MTIINNLKELNIQLKEWKQSGHTIGFVPTMGALHTGHSSLLKESHSKVSKTVCSIFVNPLQFNNLEDYDKYPVTLDQDIALLQELNCDLLFLPSEKEVYPDDVSRHKQYDLGNLDIVLEGKFRPGHLQGVCLVVERLLTLIGPDVLFLGQKDYQQCLVIKKLIQIMKVPIVLTICPTMREKSGLAKSSRNLRLSQEDQAIAPELYKSLRDLEANLLKDSIPELLENAIKKLETFGFRVEYLVLAKADTLEEASEFYPTEKYVLLVAAYLNQVRLIDNIEINGAYGLNRNTLLKSH